MQEYKLMKVLATIILLLASHVSIASTDIDCSTSATTIDINKCKAQEVELVYATLKQYLSASLRQNKEDKITSEFIQESQHEWEKYSEKHCKTIYQKFIDGSIRNVMYHECKLRLAKRRTYELWYSYLTYMDSTPPVLPNPQRVKAKATRDTNSQKYADTYFWSRLCLLSYPDNSLFLARLYPTSLREWLIHSSAITFDKPKGAFVEFQKEKGDASMTHFNKLTSGEALKLCQELEMAAEQEVKGMLKKLTATNIPVLTN